MSSVVHVLQSTSTEITLNLYGLTCGVVSVGSRLVPRPRHQYPHRDAPGYSLYPGSSLLHTQDTTERGYISLFHLRTQIEFFDSLFLLHAIHSPFYRRVYINILYSGFKKYNLCLLMK
jgi:hypothetical protein